MIALAHAILKIAIYLETNVPYKEIQYWYYVSLPSSDAKQADVINHTLG